MDSAINLLQKKMTGNSNSPLLREIIEIISIEHQLKTPKYGWKFPPMHKAALERKYTKVNKLSHKLLCECICRRFFT